ncbi:FUSC family protein [Sediminitomix flava]|uniref:Putative membrane protein YccC n=1 Tax=Sediminitomix flava TaxID=379075 RepID=A0A315ZF03_SEDFL|nr:FUSC family membrane protein [Sediminitomix flava]PWJ44101.1 putative membrane protein YccC [Sediminitomix flava]
MTIAIVVPIILGAILGDISTGVIAGVGAMCLGLSDSPGTFKEKFNGLLVANIFVFAITFIGSFLAPYFISLLLFIVCACFFLSIISVYGNRAAMIGTATMIALTFSFSVERTPLEAFLFASWTLAGGIGYSFISLLFWGVKPYQMIQNELSATYLETGKYIQLKSKLYGHVGATDSLSDSLIKQQLNVSVQQNKVRELLLNRRSALQGTTRLGRSMVILLKRVVDLYEMANVIHYDYEELNNSMPSSLMSKVGGVFNAIGEQMIEMGYHIQRGERWKSTNDQEEVIQELVAEVDELIKLHVEDYPFRHLVALKNILRNFSRLNRKLLRTGKYSNPSVDLKIDQPKELTLSAFTAPTSYSIQKLLNNLSLESAYFRHAIRMSATVSLAFVVVRFLGVQEGYWALLAIVVILKPSFSATKQRVFERALGTIFGGGISFLIFPFISNSFISFTLLFAFTLATFSLLSFNYGLGVLFITPYAILLFSFSKGGDMDIAWIRIVDNLVGASLAWIANYLIFPNWEYKNSKTKLQAVLKANHSYLMEVMKIYTGEDYNENNFKLARKQAYIENANLVDSFQSMLAEPKRYQKDKTHIHSFVIYSQEFAAHTATLAVYRKTIPQQFLFPEFKDLRKEISKILTQAEKNLISTHSRENETSFQIEELEKLSTRNSELINKRIEEIQEGQIETETKYLLTDVMLVENQFQYLIQLSQNFLSNSRKITTD